MTSPSEPSRRPPQGERPGWSLIALVLLGHAWLLGGVHVLPDPLPSTGPSPAPWSDGPPPSPPVGSDVAGPAPPVPVFLSEVRWIEAPAPSAPAALADEPAAPRPTPRAAHAPRPKPPAQAVAPTHAELETDVATGNPSTADRVDAGAAQPPNPEVTAALHALPSGSPPSTVPAAHDPAPEAGAPNDPAPAPPASGPADPTPAPLQTAVAPPPPGAASPERRHPVPVHAPPAQVAPPAELRYDVMATRANGQRFQLQATLRWTHDNTHYDARFSMGALLLGERVQHSRGQIHAGGLSPERFSDRRRSERAAHFEPAAGRIRFSANTPDAPWQAGVQDRLSLFLQLGALLNARPEAYPEGRTLELTVAGTDDAEPWHFVVGGLTEESLPAGAVSARLLRREPRHPHDSRVELWLAPALAHLPVRIRITQANGDVADQRLSRMP